MGKYGEIAVKATQLCMQMDFNPKTAWEDCVREFFPDSESSRKKACPRSTFLGLAEAGLLKGIPCGVYVDSPNNKQYALDAVKILRVDSSMADDPKELWKSLPGVRLDPHEGEKTHKSYNQQMHVVTALWKAGLIVR